MFIEIRKRGEIKKYYLIHSYREKNQVKRISKYLGSNLSEKQLLELGKIAGQTILEEIKEKNVLEFELTREEIEKYKESEKKIKIAHLQKEDWEKFTQIFTYNTNAIEGSTVALSDVKSLLDKKKQPQNSDDLETLNVAKAVEFIKISTEELSISLIKNLHLICFRGTKRFAGKLRDVEVVVRDSLGNVIHQGAPKEKVEQLLKELCSWYEKHKNKYPPLLLAAVVHNQFEKIHPFQDGNGRIGRLLLNYVLIRHGYPPINIKLKDRGRYYECLHKYDQKNNINSTLNFLISQYKKRI